MLVPGDVKPSIAIAALAGAFILAVVLVAALASRPAPSSAEPSPTAPLVTSPSPTVAASTVSPALTPAPTVSPTAANATASAVAMTWRQVTSAPRGEARITDVYGAPGSPFIAVGQAAGVHASVRSYVWTSQDGATWRLLADDPVFEGAAIFAVAPAPGGGFVAVGRTTEGNRVFRSPDGASWKKAGEIAGRDDNVVALVRWSGGVVAVGSTSHGPSHKGLIWTSSDGETFTRVPDAPHFVQATIDDVAVHRDRLVAVGSVNVITPGSFPRAAVWTSTDGKAWSLVSGLEAADSAQMDGVTASDRGLVAVGSSVEPRGQAVWTSADGVTWKRAPHGPAFAPGLASGGMHDVVPVSGGYVAVGNTGGPNDVMIWMSSDGTSWTRADLGPALRGGQIAAVATNGSRVVAGGVNGEGQVAFWISPP